MMAPVRKIYIFVMCVESNGSPEAKASGPNLAAQGNLVAKATRSE